LTHVVADWVAESLKDLFEATPPKSWPGRRAVEQTDAPNI